MSQYTILPMIQVFHIYLQQFNRHILKEVLNIKSVICPAY